LAYISKQSKEGQYTKPAIFSSLSKAVSLNRYKVFGLCSFNEKIGYINYAQHTYVKLIKS